jgi:hypothetical protein
MSTTTVGTTTVIHGGKSFTATDGEAQSLYIEDRFNPNSRNQVDYKFELSGAHDGEPIRVWVLTVQAERDEDGWHAAFDGVVWADDETVFDASLLDAYTGDLTDQLREVVTDFRN